MRNSMQIALLILAVVYFVSPVDLAPGILIDDFAVLAVALAPVLKGSSRS